MDAFAEFADSIRMIVHQTLAGIPMPYHGHIVGGYSPTEGTVTVVRASTAGLPNTDTSGPHVTHDVLLLTPAYKSQGGPKGGERCVVFPLDGQSACLITHDVDDSPGAPIGEQWIGHDGTTSAFKLENANGGTAHVIGAGHAIIESPIVDTNATTKATITAPQAVVAASTSITLTSPTLDLSCGQIIATNGTVTFIPNGGGSSSSVLRASDLVALLSWLLSHQHSNGNGGGNTGPPITTPPAVPGSSIFSFG